MALQTRIQFECFMAIDKAEQKVQGYLQTPSKSHVSAFCPPPRTILTIVILICFIGCKAHFENSTTLAQKLFLDSPPERQDVLNRHNTASSAVTLPTTRYPPALAKPVSSNVSAEFSGRGSVQLLKSFCCRYLTSKFISNRRTRNPGITVRSDINVSVIVNHTFLNRCLNSFIGHASLQLYSRTGYVPLRILRDILILRSISEQQHPTVTKVAE